MPDPVTVMPVDRQIAAAYWRAYPGASSNHREYADAIERGEHDAFEAVQVACSSRLSAEQAGYERAVREIVGWLRETGWALSTYAEIADAIEALAHKESGE